MPKKATFKTGTTGPEFTNDAQVAKHDTDILPAMVNATIGSDMPSHHDSKRAPENK